MRLNIFEGFRRVMMTAILLWWAGVAAIAYLDDPWVEMTYFIYGPGREPIRYYSLCGPQDATDYRYMDSLAGRSVHVQFCFAAHEASDGRMLVPFKTEGDRWIMNERYSSDVTAYKEPVVAGFIMPLADAEAADELWRKERNSQNLYAAGAGVGGSIGIWLFAFVVGWIVRGFLGVPRGQDFRPQ